MQIGICDDEEQVRGLLDAKIRLIYPNEDIRHYSSGDELLAESEPADILFLDIRMEGTDGMEVARRLRRKGWHTVVIFVTALEQYVYDAFDVGAFHYLVKPFDKAKFYEVLERAVRQCQEQKQVTAAVENSIEKNAGTGIKNICSILNADEECPSVQIKSEGVSRRIAIADIFYAEVNNRKIVLHTIWGTVEYYGRMQELEAQAGDLLYRSHRGYLVNFLHVERYDHESIYFEKGRALLAKKRYSDFVRKYMEYGYRVAGGAP